MVRTVEDGFGRIGPDWWTGEMVGTVRLGPERQNRVGRVRHGTVGIGVTRKGVERMQRGTGVYRKEMM